MVVLVGVDLSLTSPGVAIHDTTTDTWLLYGFAQRKREQGIRKHQGKTTLCLLPRIPNSDTTNEERYEHIRSHVMETILLPYRAEPQVVVGIENYAFAAQSGHSYKLQELGGILKHSLWKTYPGWHQEAIPPAQWKKQVIGNGRATKKDALLHVGQYGPCISLLCELGLSMSTTGEVPCPAQDLADAACIVLYLAGHPHRHSRESDHRKRQKVPSTH